MTPAPAPQMTPESNFTVENVVMDALRRMEKKQDELYLKVNTIEIRLASLPCNVQKEKISTLQKIVYGAVALILVGFLASISNTLNKQSKVIYTHPMVQTQGAIPNASKPGKP